MDRHSSLCHYFLASSCPLRAPELVTLPSASNTLCSFSLHRHNTQRSIIAFNLTIWCHEWHLPTCLALQDGSANCSLQCCRSMWNTTHRSRVTGQSPHPFSPLLQAWISTSPLLHRGIVTASLLTSLRLGYRNFRSFLFQDNRNPSFQPK